MRNETSSMVLEDSIRFTSTPTTSEKSNNPSPRRRIIIYHIGGNPGVIEYYRDFLHILSTKLGEHNEKHIYDFEIYGRSMHGFELNRHTTAGNQSGALGLHEQIEAVEGDVLDYVRQAASQSGCEDSIASTKSEGGCEDIGTPTETSVVLIGHSVGAYIALDIISRHRRRLAELSTTTSPKPAHSSEPHIAGAVLLFPTIVDIATSWRGQKLTPFSRIPLFPQLVTAAAQILTSLPKKLLLPLLAKFTGFEARNTYITASFLSSARAVGTAMKMARDEMQVIKADAWSEEVWGAESPSPLGVPRPKLFFFFGKDDYWVNEETRKAIIASRGGDEDWRPCIEQDATNIPHGFSIAHSEPVAEQCRIYIEDVVKSLSASGQAAT